MTPKKYPQNFHTQKIYIFLKTQKNIEIQKFDPKKMDQAYVCMKISEYPPWGLSRPLGAVAGYSQLWLMSGSQEIKGGRV